MTSLSLRRRLGRFVRRIRRDQRGLALTEFAFSLPIFMGLGMYGTEIAYLAIVNMQMSQAALNLADNASRLGQTQTNAASVSIKESDILTVLAGARLQTEQFDLFDRGRVILSSLERNPEDGQWIHWQRCKGIGAYQSQYGTLGTMGTQGTGTTGTSFAGMGEPGEELTASPNTAVMYVELIYEYEGLFGNLFVEGTVLRHRAAHNIRDDRNLGAGLSDDAGSDKATCDKFENS